jgi:type I restriction enzyme M protein
MLEPLISRGTALIVPKEKIAANGDYNLSGERYREVGTRSSQFPIVPLGSVAEVIAGQSPPGDSYNETGTGVPFYQGKTEFGEVFIGPPKKWTTDPQRFAEPGDVFMSVRAPVGPVNLTAQRICIGRGLAAIRPADGRLLTRYIFYLLRSMESEITGDTGAAFASINRRDIQNIPIPLPPLEVQKEIVAEIEGYQKVIDGARAVIDNYHPHIPIHPDWPMVEIGEVCKLINGRAFRPMDWKRAESGGMPIVRIQNLNDWSAEFNYFTGGVSQRHTIDSGELLFSWSGSRGTSFGAHVWPGPRAVLNQHIFKVEFLSYRANKTFLLHALNGAIAEVEGNLHGGVGLVHITKGNLERIKIPLPTLSEQESVAAEIEAEQTLVNANRDLIVRMEQKIQATLARVWMQETGDMPK